MKDRGDIDAHDEEKLLPRVDPFRVTIVGRMIGTVLWGLQTVASVITWPLRAGLHFLLAVIDDLQWRLSKLSSAIVDLFGRIWWRVMQVTRLDRVLHQVDSAAQSATRSVTDITAAVGERTIGSPWLHAVAEKLSELRHRIGQVWYALLDRASQSRVLRVIVIPLRLLTRCLGDALDFLIGWLWTREYRHLLFGIPGFVLMIPLVVLAVRLPFQTPAATAKDYRIAANAAMADEDFELAELCFRKLSQLGFVHEMVTMRAALFAASQDEWGEAYNKMRQIAPLQDDEGLAEAHLWIAQTIADGKIEQGNADADALLEQHLRRAIDNWPGDESHLTLWLAEICRQSNRGQEAVDCLAKIDADDVDVVGRSKMAEIYSVVGRHREARRLARSTYSDLRAKDDRQEQLTPTEYLVWGACAEMLGDVRRASDLILLGLEEYPEDADLRATAPLICATRYDLMPNYSDADKQRRMAFLKKLVTVSADVEPCLTRVAVLVNDEAVGEEAQRLIDDASLPLPSRTQQALGDMAMLRGDRLAARQFYRDASDQDTANHVALNNLAYLYSHVEPKQPRVALELANRAVSLSPENPHYLETRGQIFLLLERWDAAIEDLSLALNGLPKNERIIHQSLAVALTRLGQREQAAFHAEAAKR